MQTIACHDCENQVSFSAVACPHCGSTEPSGGYQLSRKEQRRLNVEQRNDKRMVACMAILAGVGIMYGIATSSGWIAALFWATAYGAIGAASGPPLALVINAASILRR